jgi:hypothetical protein
MSHHDRMREHGTPIERDGTASDQDEPLHLPGELPAWAEALGFLFVAACIGASVYFAWVAR